MAKVRDSKGNEIEGRSVITGAQANALAHWDAIKSHAVKAERVAVREAARASRSPREQLALLDQRLGIGQGAVKERARLNALVPAKK